MKRENSVILRRGLAVTEPENDEDLQEEEDLFRPPAKFFAEPSDNIVASSRIEGGRLYVRFYADAIPTETDERVGKRVSEMLSKNEGERGDYGAPFTGRIAAGYALAKEVPRQTAIVPVANPAEQGPSGSASALPREPAKTFAATKPREQEKRPMASAENDLTTTQSEVLAAYKRAAKELGRPPSNVELAEDLVDTVMSKSTEGRVQLVSKARAALVKLGLADKAKKGGRGRRDEVVLKPVTKAKSVPPKSTKPRVIAAPVVVTPAAPRDEDPVIRVMREEAKKAADRAEMLNRALAAMAGS